MTAMMRCEQCGKEIPKTANRRFCKECGTERNAESSRRAARRKQEEIKAARLATADRPRKCLGCGQEIPKTPNRQYCSACARKRRRQQDEVRREQYKRAGRKKTAVPPEQKKRNELFSLAGKSLAEVSLEARALGMSYGQYTSACSGGTIGAVLAADGISRDKARRLIAAEKKRNTPAQRKTKKAG